MKTEWKKELGGEGGSFVLGLSAVVWLSGELLHKQKEVVQAPVVARFFFPQAFFYLTFPTYYINGQYVWPSK